MSDTSFGWGSDVPVSMPEPIDPDDIVIDMGTHVMTRSGLRLYANAAVRQEIVANAFAPVDDGSD